MSALTIDQIKSYATRVSAQDSRRDIEDALGLNQGQARSVYEYVRRKGRFAVDLGPSVAQDERSPESGISSRVGPCACSAPCMERTEPIAPPEGSKPPPTPHEDNVEYAFFKEPQAPSFYDNVFDGAYKYAVEQVRKEADSILQRKTVHIRHTNYKVAVLSDLQIPFQDNLALEIAFDILHEYKPDMIYLLGDVIDNHAISRWLTDESKRSYMLEREIARDFLNRLRESFPTVRIRWKNGNHEDRLSAKLYSTPGLSDLLGDELSMERIYNMRDLHVEYVTQVDRIGRLAYIHGHEDPFKGGKLHVAYNRLRAMNRSIISAHNHIFQWYAIKEHDGTWKASYVNGCLFNIKKMPSGGYSSLDTCQRGISTVDYDAMGYFKVTPLPFIETGGGGLSVFYRGDFQEYSLG